jgi:hypothetical protein
MKAVESSIIKYFRRRSPAERVGVASVIAEEVEPCCPNQEGAKLFWQVISSGFASHS